MSKPRRKPKHSPKDQLLWLVVGAGAAMLASTLVEQSMRSGWRAVMSHDPPKKPESPETGWKEAIVWTALSALAMGLTQTFAKRGAAIGWEHVRGKQPPF